MKTIDTGTGGLIGHAIASDAIQSLINNIQHAVDLVKWTDRDARGYVRWIQDSKGDSYSNRILARAG